VIEVCDNLLLLWWLVDDGIYPDEDALPPEVTDDDQQLFSLAVQVCLCTVFRKKHPLTFSYISSRIMH